MDMWISLTQAGKKPRCIIKDTVHFSNNLHMDFAYRFCFNSFISGTTQRRFQEILLHKSSLLHPQDSSNVPPPPRCQVDLVRVHLSVYGRKLSCQLNTKTQSPGSLKKKSSSQNQCPTASIRTLDRRLH